MLKRWHFVCGYLDQGYVFAYLLFSRITLPYHQKTQGTGAIAAATEPSKVNVHLTVRALYIGPMAKTMPPLAK